MEDLEKRLEKILRYSGGEWSLEDFLNLIRTKKLHLLEYEGILVLIEVQTYPQKRILHIWGAEGKGALKKLPLLVSWAKDVARSLDCNELRCQGRKGWERALQEHGTRVLYTTLAMEL